MSTAISIPGVVFVIITLLAFYQSVIYPTLISPLAKIPNAHWTAPISPLWILWTRFRCHENRSVHAAHMKKGPVVRLGPNELSINSVDGGIRTVYGGGFEKHDWYSIFDNYGAQCMFSALKSRPHSTMKRMISNVYSKSVIQSSPAIHSHARVILYDRLLPIISASTRVNSAQGLDVHDIWNGTTMDFITAYLFGLSASSNFLQSETYRRHWLRLYQGRKKYTFFGQELPRLTKFANSIGVRFVPRWVDFANREIEAWTRGMCQIAVANIASSFETSQISNPINDPVVVRAMLAGLEKEKQTKGSSSILSSTALTHPELTLASEMLDHLAAGFETTGITLTFLTWQLSRNLALQASLRAELLTLSQCLIFPPPSPSHENQHHLLPDSRELDNLPLLHAIIMETLRLQGPLPGGQPRITPFPSCTIGPYDNIPGGIRVGAAAHSLHRNEAVYADPETWDHTRWLENSERGDEARKDRDRWFWAFGSGGRMCIGSNFAMHEIKLIVAAVYTNFTTHIVDDEGIDQEDGYTCGPAANKLFLRAECVES